MRFSLIFWLSLIVFNLLITFVFTETNFFPWNQTGSAHEPYLNWAVILCTSRNWYNYRHAANAIAFYRELKRLSWPDSNIFLLVAEDMTISSHNPISPYILLPTGYDSFNFRRSSNYPLSWKFSDIIIDYVGQEVSAEKIMRLMTDSFDGPTTPVKRLRSSSKSNILLYITGHGGEQFLKFHDRDDWNAQDLATMIHTMHAKDLYGKLWVIIDTCQAESLFHHITSPNVIMLASSRLGESSYSHHVNNDLGVSVIDGMTFQMIRFINDLSPNDKKTIRDLMNALDPREIRSNPIIRSSNRSSDFFKVSDYI